MKHIQKNKILLLIYVVVFLVLLVGCANSPNTTQPEPPPQIETTPTQPVEPVEPIEPPNNSTDPATSNINNNNSSQTSKTPSAASKPKQENTTKPEIKPEAKLETKPTTKPEAKPEAKPETKPETKPEVKPETKPEDNNQMHSIKLIIGDKTFSAQLYQNQATTALLKQFPMTVSMGELNGNEKYYYLADKLPTNASQPAGIHTGDIMLYGSDCLVLFYKNFSTSYSYTPIGYIENPADLPNALEGESVQITFQLSNSTTS